MTLLDELRPSQKRRVFDLVKEAGIDVTDWANYSRGPNYAAMNPKYCYEWAFVQRGRVVVLNLWHTQLREHQNTVTWSDNLCEWIRRHSDQDTKAIWRRRAEAFDSAIQVAFKESLTVRAIVNDGNIREGASRDTQASVVKHRLLDPVPWAVTSYEAFTGHCTLTRGVLAKGSVDQFDIQSPENRTTQKVSVQTQVFQRDSSIRVAARHRANGKCELCHCLGFIMADGRVYIETHHVIPLSEGGRDSADNVVAICPNHHREAHHGSSAAVIRESLLKHLRSVGKE